VLLIGIPSALGLFILARPMITSLFMYRDFTAADVDMAGLSLMAYAIGLPAFMLIKVLAPGFYSRKDPRTPVRIAIVALVTNMVLNLVFVVPMVKLGIPGPHAGLALATSVAAYVNAALLFWVLYRDRFYRPRPGWRRFALQMLLAGGVMVAVLVWGMPSLSAWIAWDVTGRVGQLSLWVAIGALVYLAGLRLGGLRWSAFRHTGHGPDGQA
jgi:putative peptidoglycan lipid II flippase